MDPRVDVIQIPWDGSSPKLLSVPLLSDEEGGPWRTDSNEEYLKIIPDLTAYYGPTFWKEVSLVELAHMDPDESVDDVPARMMEVEPLIDTW